jgi:hypothetical protein
MRLAQLAKIGKALSFSAFLIFYVPVKSFAWGMLGHRIVGEIASTYLTKHAQKEIKKILGNETIAIASNWADFIKSDTSYKYLNEWHYADVDKGVSEAQMLTVLENDTSANAYNKIVLLTKELKNKNLQQTQKQMYLRLLIHLVGDVHQPFHVSATGDRGGNDIKVTWFSEPSNIHRVWDEQLIDYQKLSYTEYTKAINFTTKNERTEWQQQPLTDWFFQSYTLSEKLHDELKKPDQKLGFLYNFNHIETLNQQLLKGGVRLAGLLNEIFD